MSRVNVKINQDFSQIINILYISFNISTGGYIIAQAEPVSCLSTEKLKKTLFQNFPKNKKKKIYENILTFTFTYAILSVNKTNAEVKQLTILKLNQQQTSIDLDALLGSVSNTYTIEATKIKKRSSTTVRSSTTQRSSTTSCSDTTETQRVNKWRQETKDTIRFDVPKGTKAQLQAEAKKRDISLTELIKKSIEMYLQIR